MRATDAKEITELDEDLAKKNIKAIKNYLVKNGVTEVWGAWGNLKDNNILKECKEKLVNMLNEIGVKVFYFGTLTIKKNPRHPIQRQEKWNLSEQNKHYL